jgi:hypothetical protein
MEPRPPREEEPIDYYPPSRGHKIVTGLLLVVLCALLAYAIVEHRTLKDLASSRDELAAELNQEHAQIQTLSQKLLAAESTPAPAPAPAPTPAPQASTNPATEEQPPTAHPVRAQSHPRRHAVVARAHRSEDPWRKQVQSQLTEQQRLIAQHQQMIQETQDSLQKARADLEGNLQSTRDDLNGSIAKNHDELVALERKGERSFYEFNLERSKQFQREGPMSISLRKSNDKHKYCDLVMIVNDSEVSKKHVNLYEPVLFYPEGYSQPLQLVINSIGKDSARGYVSEPKYKSSEMAASATSSSATAPGPAAQTATGASPEAATLKRRPAAQD